jgi:hypothetical protein
MITINNNFFFNLLMITINKDKNKIILNFTFQIKSIIAFQY